MTPLWSESDIAAALGTTPAKVRKLAEKDGLPSIDVPRVGRRFDPIAVEQWVRERRNQNTENTKGGQ